jgi:iron complex outermembrane receptor protein
MVSGSYNRYYYTEDLQTGTTKTASIKGNQIPDAPEYMANAALAFHDRGWRLTPSLRYYSERYGDVDNTQKIQGATLVDVDASYTYRNLWAFKEATFRVTLTNLFNREYISSIITPDNALAANTTKTSYQSGAPFGAYAGIALKF